MGLFQRLRKENAIKRAAAAQVVKEKTTEEKTVAEEPTHTARIHTIPELTRKDYDSFEICLAFVPDLYKHQPRASSTETHDDQPTVTAIPKAPETPTL